jgi:hypothetical protein
MVLSPPICVAASKSRKHVSNNLLKNSLEGMLRRTLEPDSKPGAAIKLGARAERRPVILD